MFKTQIQAKFSQAGILLSEAQAEAFARYHEMLAEANQRMNLTRIALDDVEETIDRHYLDSAAPVGLGLVSGAVSLLDVGSGAGLPGIPLSILLPKARVTLLDSLQKRVGFLNEVIAALQLNAIAVHARAEDAAKDIAYRERFDVVTARAVAALPQLLELTLPFAKVGGAVLAYKGPSLDEELLAARRALQVLGGGDARGYAAKIPGRDWDHRLAWVRKVKGTPGGYPRKPAEIAKKVL